MERCSSQVWRSTVLPGLICGVVIASAFLISQRLPKQTARIARIFPTSPQFYIWEVKFLPSKHYLCTYGVKIIIIYIASIPETHVQSLQSYRPALCATRLFWGGFLINIKELDVRVWGKGTEMKIQGTERRCLGLVIGPWLCWRWSPEFLSQWSTH